MSTKDGRMRTDYKLDVSPSYSTVGGALFSTQSLPTHSIEVTCETAFYRKLLLRNKTSHNFAMNILSRLVAAENPSMSSTDRTPTPALGAVVVVIEVLAAKDLIAKDKNMLGRRTTSDPYVSVFCERLGEKVEIGKTKSISKCLNPIWNQKLDLVLDGDDRILRDGIDLIFEIYDYDSVSCDDIMGSVSVHLDLLESVTEKWYPVEKGTNPACHNAKGDLHLAMSVTGRCVPGLVSGNSFDLPLRNVGVAWNSESLGELDMELACVALDHESNFVRADSLYFGNPSSKLALRCQKRDGCQASLGYDFLLDFPYEQMPVLCSTYYYYLVLTVSSEHFLNDLRENHVDMRVRFFGNSETAAFELRPRSFREGTTATVLCCFRSQGVNSAKVDIIDHSFTGPRDFGGVLPQLGFYEGSECLTPIAITQSGSSIFVDDFFDQIPEWTNFGVAWSIPVDFDVDLSAVCMSEDLQELEIVSFRQLLSRDKALKHLGDARVDDNQEGEDDEIVRAALNRFSDQVHHIGFVVNSHSGPVLSNLSRLSFHLFNEEPFSDIAVNDFVNLTRLENKTAVVLAGLTRKEDRWKFRVFNRPAEGNVGHDCIEELQEAFSSQESAIPPSTPLFGPFVGLPQSIDVMTVDEEIMIPAFEFVKYMAGEADITFE